MVANAQRRALCREKAAPRNASDMFSHLKNTHKLEILCAYSTLPCRRRLTHYPFAAFLDLGTLLGQAAPLSSSMNALITSADTIFLCHTMSLLRTPIVRVLARRVVPSFRDFCRLFWGAPVSVAERGVKLMYLLHRTKLPPWHPEHFSLSASVYTRPRQRISQATAPPAAGAGAAAAAGAPAVHGTPLAAHGTHALSNAGITPNMLIQCVGGEAGDERGAGGVYKPQAAKLQLGAWLTYALAVCILRQRGSSHFPSPPSDGRPPPAQLLPLLNAWRVPQEEGAAMPPASQAAVAAAGTLGAAGGFVALAEQLHRQGADAQAQTQVARGLSSSLLGKVFHLDDPCSDLSRAGEQPLITQGAARVVAGGCALEFTFAPQATRAFNFAGMEGCHSHVSITATNRQLSTPTRTVRVGPLQPAGGVRPQRQLRAALMEAHSAVGAQEWTLQEARAWVADTALHLMSAAAATGGFWPDGATHSLYATAPVATTAAFVEGTRRLCTADATMGGLLDQLQGALAEAVRAAFPNPPTVDFLAQHMTGGGYPQVCAAVTNALHSAAKEADCSSMGPWAAAVAGLTSLAVQRGRQHAAAATWARCSEVGEGGARVLGKMFKADPGAYLSAGGFEGSGASSIGSLTLATAHEYSSVPSGSRGARITGIVGASELNWVTARFCVDELFRVAVATDRVEVAARRLADEVQEVLAVRRAQATGSLPLGVAPRPSARLAPTADIHRIVAASGPAAVGYGGFFSRAFDDFRAFQGAVQAKARDEAEPVADMLMPQQRAPLATPQHSETPDFIQHGYAAPNSCLAPEVPFEPPLHGAYGTVAQGAAPPPAPPRDSAAPSMSSASPFLDSSAFSSSSAACAKHDDDAESDGEDDGEVVVGAVPEHVEQEQANGDDDVQIDAKAAQFASLAKKRQRPAPFATNSASGGGGGGGGGGSLTPWGGAQGARDDGYSTLPMHAWWASLWRSDAELGWVWVPAYYAWHAMADRPAVQAIGGAAAPLADRRQWELLQELAGRVPAVYATGATSGLWWLI